MLEITLIGNLGKDAMLKTINGKDYIVFSVCHSERYVDGNGQNRDLTTWVSCYKQGTGKILNYLRKGTLVFVRGTLSIKVVVEKGKEYVNINCSVSKIQLLSSSKDTEQTAAVSPEPSPEDDTDDLPF